MGAEQSPVRKDVTCLFTGWYAWCHSSYKILSTFVSVTIMSLKCPCGCVGRRFKEKARSLLSQQALPLLMRLWCFRQEQSCRHREGGRKLLSYQEDKEDMVVPGWISTEKESLPAERKDERLKIWFPQLEMTCQCSLKTKAHLCQVPTTFFSTARSTQQLKSQYPH